MRIAVCLAALVVLALAACGGDPAPTATPTSEQRLCSLFRQNADGTWSALQSMVVAVQSVRLDIGAGTTFTPGVEVQGVPLADSLNRTCAPFLQPTKQAG